MKKIHYLFYLIILLIILVTINEIYHTMKRQSDRLIKFDLAKKRATMLNKPLIVIGDPHNGRASRFFSKFNKTYGCGDETVDLNGAPRCPNGIKSDVYNYLRTKPSNYGVIFISCVLEYIDNVDDTIKELYRVTGSNDNLFVICVNDKSLSAYIYKDKTDVSKNLVYVDEMGNISYKKL